MGIKTMPKCIVCRELCGEGRGLTCSENCHEVFIEHLIAKFGEYKKVVRMTTGVAYKVPTRDILERGIKEKGLDQYPVWEDDHA